MTIYVTDHAIQRYRERVEADCSFHDAEDRIKHAVSIAKPASPAMVWEFRSKVRVDREIKFLHCPVESLFLVCRPCDDGLAVLTVLSVVLALEARRVYA